MNLQCITQLFALPCGQKKLNDKKKNNDFAMKLQIKQCLHKVSDKKSSNKKQTGDQKPPISTVYDLTYALSNDRTDEDLEKCPATYCPSRAPLKARKRMLKHLEISCIFVSYKKKQLKMFNTVNNSEIGVRDGQYRRLIV